MFNIHDTRPLEVAAYLISRKLGVPISYEDPVWVAQGDVIPGADYPGNEKLATRNFPRGPLIPRGGQLDVVIPNNVAIGGVQGLIEATLSSHHRSRNPGEFRFVTFGESEFAIVPERVADKDGRIIAHTSPFDTRISFPEEERTLSETIEMILLTVREGRRVRIVNGFSIKSFDQRVPAKIRVGANNEVAREVLSRVLHIPGQAKLSWWLRYDPQDQFYVLNLVSVQKEVKIPAGGEGLEYVYWPRK